MIHQARSRGGETPPEEMRKMAKLASDECLAKGVTSFQDAGSSYETVAHRMCNLSDPRRRGVPMHFLRVDVAGNISKRYSGDGIRFPHGDGSCPKMAVHLAFLTPSVITKQYSAFPDGSTYFQAGSTYESSVQQDAGST